jgi:hypothetical protein
VNLKLAALAFTGKKVVMVFDSCNRMFVPCEKFPYIHEAILTFPDLVAQAFQTETEWDQAAQNISPFRLDGQIW